MQRYRLADNGLDHPNQSVPNWERVHAAMARPAMTPAEAKRCAPGTTVKVRGVVRAGGAGPLTAPISGQQCAWYRAYVQPGNWLLRPLPPQGRFSDIMLVAQPTRGFSRRHDPTDEISDVPFAVAGSDGVTLGVDPRIADVNSDQVARNRVVASRFGFTRQLLVEFVLPAGAEVVLLGDMGSDGQLVSSKDAFVFVSTRPDAKIVDRAAHGAGEHDRSAATFRFVRRGNRIARGLGSFTRVLGIVIIVGILLFLIYLLVVQ